MDKTLDIIGIGAANMDIIARVDTFPESDDQVPITSLKYAPGGSVANTIVGITKLGLKTGFLGRVGHDHNGEELENAFKDVGVDTEGIIIDTSLPSGQVFIPVDKNGERMIFSFPGAPQSLKKEDIRAKMSFLRKALVIHLGSLRVTEPLTEAAQLSKKLDCIVSMNPGSMNAARGYLGLKNILDNVDLLVVSRREFDKMFGFADIERNAKLCFDKTAVQLVVVTLGPRGAKYFIRGQSSEIEPIFPVPVVNTTGAGDGFAAGFMAKLFKPFKEWLGSQQKKEHTYKDLFQEFLKTKSETPDFFMECLRYGNATAAFVVQGESPRANLPTLDMVTKFIQANK
nr:carbohydrate kinase family protein [Candidatus Sigynarchaeota archaeon]